jgi:hypothetical protein
MAPPALAGCHRRYRCGQSLSLADGRRRTAVGRPAGRHWQNRPGPGPVSTPPLSLAAGQSAGQALQQLTRTTRGSDSRRARTRTMATRLGFTEQRHRRAGLGVVPSVRVVLSAAPGPAPLNGPGVGGAGVFRVPAVSGRRADLLPRSLGVVGSGCGPPAALDSLSPGSGYPPAAAVSGIRVVWGRSGQRFLEGVKQVWIACAKTRYGILCTRGREFYSTSI